MRINMIVKTVGVNCNLRCEYCFYREHNRKKVCLDQNMLEMIIREACKYNQQNAEFMFYWHGGEPLLAGVDFFREVCNLQREIKGPNQIIHNGITTNGTLLTKEWARLFCEENIRPTVSLDGPQRLHDKHRRFPDGEGSFHKVMKGIKTLEQAGVEFNILSVVTEDSIGEEEKIFKFFASSEFTNTINFSPSLGVEDREGISFNSSVSPSKYIDFLIRIFDLWLEEDRADIKILPLESIVRGLLGGVQRDCRFANMEECKRNVVIDYNGDITACGGHGYGDTFYLGNIRKGLRPVMKGKPYRNYEIFLKEIVDRCSQCNWYKVCHGGCPRDHYLGKGHNVFCPEIKRLFGHIKNCL